MKKTFLKENFEEMSEVHRSNMFYPYFSIDASGFVTVSPSE